MYIDTPLDTRRVIWGLRDISIVINEITERANGNKASVTPRVRVEGPGDGNDIPRNQGIAALVDGDTVEAIGCGLSGDGRPLDC